MSWQEEVFGPLLARTVENAQVQHLAEHYDLARVSRLAQAIVRYANEVLDAEEKRRQVKRVRPGELPAYGPRSGNAFGQQREGHSKP